MAGERVFYPPEPPRDLLEMHERIQEIALGFNSERVVIEGVTIGTSITAVGHGGRGKVPRRAYCNPRTAVTVGQRPQAPDGTNVYFIAASSVVCDVEVYF
ncbi:MAG TPA: hypothetical protein VFV05_09480 [Methylomirabilota bacterium]|nr:hypothetical protein [Methylomirabilota bacterium]